jgi:hypothetical protein
LDGKARSTVRLVLLLGTALGFLLTCKIPQNPLRAGSSTSTAAQLDHPINFGGHKHADGYCNPIDNCSACHGSSLQGGSHGEPSCTSCHGTFWTDPNCGKLLDVHTLNLGGVLHGANPCQPQGVCTPCHGANLQGGTNGEPACTKCHGPVWTSADCGTNSHTVNLGGVFHKPNYCLPYQNCPDCHGVNLRGGTGGQPSCLSCHDQKKWQNCGSIQHTKSRDGILHATGTVTTVCVNCHGSDLRGGYNNEPSCYKCHGKTW